MRINLQAPINQLGYGVAGINILKALYAEGVEVSFFPIGQPQVTNEEDAHTVRRGMRLAQTFDPQAPCIKIWHQNQMAERIGSGKFIGFPIFELDTFSDLEKHHLNSCDELMVCSKWAKQVCLDQLYMSPNGHTYLDADAKVHVVPLGVDAELFPPAPVRQDDKTIFFNCGKWEIRKGHDILIEAFKKLTEEHDNVELWMMCSNPFNSEEENARWHQLYNHPKVKLIPRAETQREVYNIMSQVDCGVFPSRGEGWNLELLEMMAVGKHVVATEYSAHTEFCTEENSYLLPISDVEPAFDNKWFFGQGNWAKIHDTEVDMLAKLMQRFIKLSKGKVNLAGIETAKKFSWQNSAKEIIKCLQN
jgi:glycosyltransferase involved in cell wall biosynthesis